MHAVVSNQSKASRGLRLIDLNRPQYSFFTCSRTAAQRFSIGTGSWLFLEISRRTINHRASRLSLVKRWARFKRDAKSNPNLTSQLFARNKGLCACVSLLGHSLAKGRRRHSKISCASLQGRERKKAAKLIEPPWNWLVRRAPTIFSCRSICGRHFM